MKVKLFLLLLAMPLSGCMNSVGELFSSRPTTSNDPSDGDDNTPLDRVRYSSSSNMALLSHKAVADQLESVFGTSSAVTSVTQAKITNQRTTFGRPWDVYANPNETICSIFVGQPCVQLSEAQAAQYSAATSEREAYRVGACYEILKRDSSGAELPLKNAIKLAKGIALNQNLTLASLSAPTSSEIEDAFQLFFFGEETDEALVSALQSLTNEVSTLSVSDGGGVVEAWRWLFLSLCSDPSWQIL